MVLSLCHMCSRGSYLNEKGMHLPHGLTWLCELSFFLHTVFIFVRSESCHIYTTSFQPFSVVILEKQPTQSKNWFWATSKPPNPSAKPPSGQSGGPSGVWLRLSTVVFAWWLESKIKWQKELSSFTKYLSRFGEMSCLQFWLCFTMQQKMKECFSNTNHSIQFIFGLAGNLVLTTELKT